MIGVRTSSELFKPLAEEDVHLWFVRQNEIDSELLEQYRALLSYEEMERAMHFRFEKDRICFVITRALARTVLSYYICDIRPCEWRFMRQEYGKPMIDLNYHPVASELEFNLSHNKSLVVMAVAFKRLIGVDVETRRNNLDRSMVERFFSVSEIDELKNLDDDWNERFFEIWTLKESYVKALGKGLSIPVDSLSFNLQVAGHIELFHEQGDVDNTLGWYFQQFRPYVDEFVSLCVENCSLSVVTTIYKTKPLVEFSVEEWKLAKSSECGI